MKVSSINSVWYKRFASVFFLSLLGFFIANLALASWSPPSGDPPSGNTAEPIDVSNVSQSKQGKFGINVGTPAYEIDVSGQINASNGMCIGGSCVSTLQPLWSKVSSSPGDIFNFGGGKVGIGVTAPFANLDIVTASSSVTGAEDLLLRVSSRQSEFETTPIFSVQGNGLTRATQLQLNGGYGGENEGWRSYQDATSGNYDLAYIYVDGANMGRSNVITVTPSQGTDLLPGYVGIGNNDPHVKLQVSDAQKAESGNYEGGVIGLSPGNSLSGEEFQSSGFVKFLSRDDTSADFWSGIEGYRNGYADQTDLRFYTEANGAGGPTQKMMINGDGQVGIGKDNLTISGDALLDVAGNGSFDGGIYTGGSINADGSISAANSLYADGLSVTNNIVSTEGHIDAPEICIASDCRTSWPSSTNYWSQGSSSIYHAGSAEVSDVGTAADTANYATFGVTRAANSANNSYIGLTRSGAYPLGIGLNQYNSLIIGLAANGKTIPSPQFALTSDGKVGIGTTAPIGKLDVRGGTASDDNDGTSLNLSAQKGGWADTSSGTNGGSIYLNTGAPGDSSGSAYSYGNVVMSVGEGAVGINDSSPSAKLSIKDASSGPIIGLKGLTTNYRGLTIYDTSATPAEQWFYGANNNNKFVIRSTSGGVGTDRLTVLNTGNVGIGTSTPAQKLSVAGTIESVTGGFKFPDETTQTSAANVNYGYFTVGGVSGRYYPVQFISTINGARTGANTSDLVIYRDDTHEDQGTNPTWYGTFNTVISFHPTLWGHFNGQIEKILYQTGTGGYVYDDPLGDVDDGTASGSGRDMIVWLKGGATYHWRNKDVTGAWSLGNGNSSGGSITDSSGATRNYRTTQTALILNAKNKLYTNEIGLGTAKNLYVGGNVGIGTTTPGYKLTVAGDINLTGNLLVNGSAFSTSQWTTSGSNIYFLSGNVGIGVNPALEKLDVIGNIGLDDNGSNTDLRIRFNQKTALTVFNTVNSPNDPLYINRDWDSTNGYHSDFNNVAMYGNVGIGENSPAYKLTLTDDTSGPIIGMKGATSVYRGISVRNTSDAEQWFYGANTSNSFVIRRSGNDDLSIDSSGNMVIANGSGATVSLAANGVLTTGKLSAAQIDPPYKINNKDYATYGLSMVGSKEEYSAIVTLQKKGKGYIATIDFDKQAEASDLWLFSKVTNLFKVFDKLIVQLTANFPGQVWYEKDEANKKLIIHAMPDGEKNKQSLEVSLRLTAPRFDYAKWLNTSEPNSAANDLDEFYKNEK